VTSDESTNFWVDAPYNDRIPSLSPYRQYSTVRLSFPRPDEFSRLVIARQALLLLDHRHELFSVSDGPHESGSPKSTGSPLSHESELEAAPWAQFVRRGP
jgi:hypothetical protein